MRPLTPTTISPPFARYSHGVEVLPGQRFVRTSGQLGLAADGTIPEGSAAQAQVIFASLDAILTEAGMTRADVIHLSAFVTDRSEMAGYMQARDAWLAEVPENALPSSTLMIVSGFTRPEFVVEIELWAAAP